LVSNSPPLTVILGRTTRVMGVGVINYAETPGLGDKIEARKSDWIKKFTGMR